MAMDDDGDGGGGGSSATVQRCGSSAFRMKWVCRDEEESPWLRRSKEENFTTNQNSLEIFEIKVDKFLKEALKEGWSDDEINSKHQPEEVELVDWYADATSHDRVCLALPRLCDPDLVAPAFGGLRLLGHLSILDISQASELFKASWTFRHNGLAKNVLMNVTIGYPIEMINVTICLLN
ncbi:hypothetical protein Syun_009252 [Stephania yunnanensis]|uniref:Uncharacterized protein n=1 Tax=Stephania yunnanensis TaxID=152371 RepID=A0AAP0KE62_9MAGN